MTRSEAFGNCLDAQETHSRALLRTGKQQLHRNAFNGRALIELRLGLSDYARAGHSTYFSARGLTTVYRWQHLVYRFRLAWRWGDKES
jgi:hypothetical protein